MVVGNGTGLSISKIGSSHSHINHSKFHLNEILYCPQASANLLFVNEFTNDNKCHFIFSSNVFVKENNVDEQKNCKCLAKEAVKSKF